MTTEDTDIPSSEQNDDPVGQLPPVIEPGEFGLTLPGIGFDGEPVRNSVWFTWGGGREVQWSQNISQDSDGMYQWASSPVRGTAAWHNGRDIEVTYNCTDFGGLDGDHLLTNAAPTRRDPSTDDGMREPAQWVYLAERLNDFVTDLLQSL